MKFLFAIALALGISAAAYAAAATLQVDGGVLQAGGDTNLQCDTDGVQVASFKIDSLTESFGARIVGFDAACEGLEAYVYATNDPANPDSVIASFTSSVVGGQVTGNWASPLDPALITDIHVVIESTDPVS